jgi:hypothetical protein
MGAIRKLEISLQMCLLVICLAAKVEPENSFTLQNAKTRMLHGTKFLKSYSQDHSLGNAW